MRFDVARANAEGERWEVAVIGGVIVVIAVLAFGAYEFLRSGGDSLLAFMAGVAVVAFLATATLIVVRSLSSPLERVDVEGFVVTLRFRKGQSRSINLAETDGGDGIRILIRPPGTTSHDRGQQSYLISLGSGGSRWRVTPEAHEGLLAAARQLKLDVTTGPCPEFGSRATQEVRIWPKGTARRA